MKNHESTSDAAKKTVISALCSLQKGDFLYKQILSDEENDVPFMVSKGVVIDNSIVFLGRKGKKKQLLKVTL